MTKNNEIHIFDDVFRTMEEHTPELMLPLINEVFKTNYPENTKIMRLAGKRHLLRKLVETDFCLSIGSKLYHFECESNPNNWTSAIRMFRYDVTVALEGKQKENDRYVVEFPASCVIYLRHGRNTKDKETVLVRMPDGRELEYAVPVVKSQKYEKEEIFRKKMIRIGRTEGHAEGHAEALAEQNKKLEAKVQLKIEEGKSAAQIAKELVEEMVEYMTSYLRDMDIRDGV